MLKVPGSYQIPSEPTHKLYRISTVMELLDVSRATIYRLVDRGELELVKIGTATRITAASVDRLVAAGKRAVG